jgi:parvulin-like peptidyl-prolyl isomerase
VFNSTHKILFLILVLTSLFITACNGSGGGTPDDAVAKVGSKDIKLKQVDTLIKRQLEQNGGATFTAAELAAARLTVIDSLIQEEALFQRAQKDNLVPDDAKVNQELQTRKQAAKMTDEQYQAQLKQAGMTEEEYKEQTRREMAITALQDKEKTRVSAPTEDEVKKYFDDHKDEFKASRGASISIIVATPTAEGMVGDAVGEAAAEQKMKAVYEQLKAGADFATIAAQRSEDNSAIRNGNIGFLSEDQLKQAFPTRPEIVTRLMTQMTDGQFTEPLKDNLSGSWAIFKLNGRREKTENLALDNQEVRQNIIDNLTQQRQQVLFKALVVTALAEANAKNYLAEQLAKDPKQISDMKPSALIQQAQQQQSQQQQPQPRVENQNTAPANSNATPAAKNANTAPASKPANSNK